jgi:hypothetical protein
MFRLDKNTGLTLGVHGTLVGRNLPVVSSDPGLGDLACDPVTFHKEVVAGVERDMYRDAMWSRRGANGNGVVALEFPAFTCGLPSNSVQNGFSPLAAGLSTGSVSQPGTGPLAACFDAAGVVIDADGDGLPDCWEATGGGIDFNGDGTVDLALCVVVDTNGDGIADTPECASPTRKNLFVEIDWMQHHKPDPKALSQTQSVASVGVKSVREAFAAAPVANPPPTPNGIAIHFQVDEQVTFIPQAGGAATSHVTHVALTPCTGPASAATSTADAVDFDAVKAGNFGTSLERLSPNSANILNAKRLAFRYVLFAHNVVGNPSGGSSGSGCAEVGGDDAVVTLGSFATTTVDGVSHNRGTTDQQAGTLMHEFGHTLGLRHGGSDGINCKPNYRSVMSYTRQFAGSPISNRRLDYSRFRVDLDEAKLNESQGLGTHVTDPSLAAISPYFPLQDQIAFGPNAWSVVTTTGLNINWDRDKQTAEASVAANINQGATAGCDGTGAVLLGQNDWSSLLYRTSAAIDFAGGARSEKPDPNPLVELTSEQEQALALAQDADGNGVGDGTDCGTFSCTHRIDIKPSFPFPKTIDPGNEATITIAIFSEVNGVSVWSAPGQVIVNDLVNFPLTFSVESFAAPVKVNNKGQGTCSSSDVADPLTGKKDRKNDLKCQFPTSFGESRVPGGTHFGVVSGFFRVNPSDPLTEIRAFSARQLVTIVE